MFDNKGGHRNQVQVSSYVQPHQQEPEPHHDAQTQLQNQLSYPGWGVKVWECQTLLIPDHTNKNTESLALKFASARKMFYLSQDLISKLIWNEYWREIMQSHS